MAATGMTAETTSEPRLYRRLNWALRQSLRVSALALLVLLAGFFLFGYAVSMSPSSSVRKADGIVALTGGEERIAEAVRLLGGGHGRRLLISGVHPRTTKPELISLNPAAASLFRCCVDLDQRALDTRDNAVETTVWVRKRGFRSLIVVTSSYHMPRTLIELRQFMPDIELIPFAVRSPVLEVERWWTDRYTLRVLGREYIKLVTALSRFAAYRLLEANSERDTQVVNASVH